MFQSFRQYREARVLLAAVVLLAAASAACGGDAGDEPDAATSPATVTSPTREPETTPATAAASPTTSPSSTASSPTVQVLLSDWAPGPDGKWDTADDQGPQPIDRGTMPLPDALNLAAAALQVAVAAPASPVAGVEPVAVTINKGPRSATGEPRGLWKAEIWYATASAGSSGIPPVSFTVIPTGLSGPGTVGAPFTADPRLQSPTSAVEGDTLVVSAGAGGRWFLVRMLVASFPSADAARDAAVTMMLDIA